MEREKQKKREKLSGEPDAGLDIRTPGS